MWNKKCYFWPHSFAQASLWFMSWPQHRLSCPPGHKAWLFCNLILVGIPAVLPCSWAAECGSKPAHLPELWSDYACSAFLTLAASPEVQRSFKSAHLSFTALSRDRIETTWVLMESQPHVCLLLKRVRKSLHTEYLYQQIFFKWTFFIVQFPGTIFPTLMLFLELSVGF